MPVGALYTHTSNEACTSSRLTCTFMRAIVLNMRERTMRKASKANGKVAVGYIRVSTEDQALGPDAQRAALATYCERHGLTLAVVHSDLGVSGAAKLDKRPGMVAALAALKEHGAGVLLVAKRDRLARDVMTAAMIESAAERVGARILSAAGEGTDADDNDPAALLMRRMVDAFAEYERAMIALRTRAALAVKAKRGEKTGGDLRIGEALAADGLHVEEDADEARAVAAIRALRADGLSIRAIVARVNAAGVPCRGERWHATTVARLLARKAA